ncbi:MAG: FAD-binding protein [Oscillospiraceae bacterium]|jgi:succinate dehydrogenase/fumarate reductase flavoprotein subunit|nr:FAD-binding protein [Oscillospiraceae bacterium]
MAEEEKKFNFFQIDSMDNAAPKPGRRWSWETPPEPIPESEIAETLETDVVIIGGGMAGLATAARCTELGLRATLIEKTKGLVSHGAHIATVGSKIQRDAGVFMDKQQFARDWLHICGSRVNEDLLWLYINRSEEAFDWLLELGGDDIIPTLFGGNYRGPDFTEYAGTHFIMKKPESTKYKYGGGLLICEIFEKEAADRGAVLLRNTNAERLEKIDGRVVSAIAKCEDGKLRRYKAKRGVVLATGDIGGDAEMLEAFCPLGLRPKRNGSFPKGSNMGEGHKLGYWAGGAFEQAPWALSLHLIAYAMYTFFFLHVNRQGKRFMNEDTWVQAKAIRCLMQKDGDWAFSVFDSKWYEELSELAIHSGGQFVDSLGAMYGQPWDNPYNNSREAIENYVKNGLCFRADTIEELAAQMDVPVENLVKTVARYNELHKKGNDDDYGKRSILLTSIDKPPYYGLKWGPALLTVFGGLLTDTKMRVLDEEQEPVPGLLAVGNVAGGLYGVDYPLLLNGNSHGRAITWARSAAETLVADEA